MDSENVCTKALVIGWDGGSFNVLDQMLKKGIMPNLEELIQAGVRADFMSTVPPITAPAWTSFRTGKSPGNHGVFGFFMPPDESLDMKKIRRNNAANIKSYAFWNILNLNGKKSCIIDMPLTDPVEKLDGIMISGMMTRGKRGVLGYPDGIIKELTEIFPNHFYKTLTDGIDVSAAFLDQLIVSLEWKKEMDLYLMGKYQWDCFVTVFSVVDLLQHYFWKFIDSGSKRYHKDSKISEKIEQFFNILDGILGQYLEQVGKNDSVYIVSDHGFGPANYDIRIPNILEQAGYIKIKHPRLSLKAWLLNPRMIKTVLKRLDVLGLRRKIKKELREHLHKTLLKENLSIDWAETKAYFRANSEEAIYINLAGKFQDGSVSPDDYEKTVGSIIKIFSDMVNPENGEKVFKHVAQRKHFYDGVFKDSAPDIVLRPAKGYALAGYKFNDQPIGPHDNPFLSGIHSENGVFIAKGPGFKKNCKVDSIRIEDFMPILLYSMQTPIPSDLDGKVCTEIFKDRFVDSCPVVFRDYDNKAVKNFQNQAGKSDDEEIKRQLARLGYID